MSYGIFDVIGPIMHGPSSNHTGGMVKIAYFIRKVIGTCPKDFTIEMHPAFYKNYPGQKTHVAVVAGMMGYRESDLDYSCAIEDANKEGIRWRTAPAEDTMSRNAIRIKTYHNGIKWSITGDSVGGGNIIITNINGVPCSLDGNAFCYVIIDSGEEGIQQITKKTRNCPNAEIYSGKTGDNQNLLIIQSKIELPDIKSSDAIYGIKNISTVEPLTVFSPKTNDNYLDLSFKNFSSLCKDRSLSELLIDYESRRDNVPKEDVLNQVEHTLDVMLDTLNRGRNGAINLIGGITDPKDGFKLLERAERNKSIVSPEFSEALGNAIIASGMNASGERIVATPTGGSAGVLPACIATFSNKFSSSREKQIDACLAAAAVGLVYSEKTNFTGTGAGCQSEIGVSAGMSAAAIVCLAGGDLDQMFHASAIAVKNLLGLSCDLPVSPIEVPCIKRNAIAVSVAMAAAEMALSGIRSVISPDDMCIALADTAKCMPSCLRCTQEHGLACTESADKMKEKWKKRLAEL